MNTIERLKAHASSRRGAVAAIARLSSLHRQTLDRALRGEDIRLSTLQEIDAAITAYEQKGTTAQKAEGA